MADRSKGGEPPRPGPAGGESLFQGGSAAAEGVRRFIGRAARVDAPVLIVGESGVGKELVARELHRRSARSAGPFVPVNCAAIPPGLVESELFGHEAGAFTDARQPRRGVFELADGGTLFLDEIGDLCLEAQPKLLRVVESGDLVRLGGERAHAVDCRLVVATNHDLRALCKEKRFREDLYFRLSVLVIRVPPLRERREDISGLAEFFARTFADRWGRAFERIDASAMELLTRHPWQGNVRELRAVVERALAMSSGYVLNRGAFELQDVSRPGLERLLDRNWKEARTAFESAYARRLLDRHDGSVRDAAREADLAPRSLYKMLARLGLRRRGGGSS